MANVDRLLLDTPRWPHLVRVQIKTIKGLLLAIMALAPIAIWNRYVFLESNAPLLLTVMIVLAFLLTHGKVPRGLHLFGVTLPFLALILYAWMRLSDPLSLNFSAPDGSDGPSGIVYVLDLFMYCALFLCAAWMYYRTCRFSTFLWFLICGYIVAFIVRNSVDLRGLQDGYNLSPGFVLVTLIPFVFLRIAQDNKMSQIVPLALWMLCTLWLAVIGARTAVGAMMIFFTVVYVWPFITRNRIRFHLTFWGAVASIPLLIALYLALVTTTGGSLIDDTGIGIFQKRLGTRVDIWIQLVYLISQQPWFGYGTDYGTNIVAPLQFLEFSYNRDTLASHSTYLEVLYRLGIAGLLFFVFLISRVWALFWHGRHLWPVRVAGAFLISIIFFNAAGGYLIFTDLRLRNGFGWIILGLGAGACLHSMKTPHVVSTGQM